MRVEELYGESSPQPTKRTDTPKSSKKKKDPKPEEEEESNFWANLFMVILVSFVFGFARGMRGTNKVTKVY